MQIDVRSFTSVMHLCRNTNLRFITGAIPYKEIKKYQMCSKNNLKVNSTHRLRSLVPKGTSKSYLLLMQRI